MKLITFKNLFYVLMSGSTILLLFVYFEKPSISYLNIPFPVVVDKIYKPNDTIRFVVDKCSRTLEPYTEGQEYIAQDPNADIKEYFLDTVPAVPNESGCVKIEGIPTKILTSMPTGWYHKRHIISQQGTFKDFVFFVNSVSFKVVNEAPTPKITPITYPTYKPYPTIHFFKNPFEPTKI